MTHLQETFPPEPEAGEGVVKIAVQLPQGRVSRRFRTDDCIGLIYDFVELQDKVCLRTFEIEGQDCCVLLMLVGTGRGRVSPVPESAESRTRGSNNQSAGVWPHAKHALVVSG